MPRDYSLGDRSGKIGNLRVVGFVDGNDGTKDTGAAESIDPHVLPRLLLSSFALGQMLQISKKEFGRRTT